LGCYTRNHIFVEKVTLTKVYAVWICLSKKLPFSALWVIRDKNDAVTTILQCYVVIEYPIRTNARMKSLTLLFIFCYHNNKKKQIIMLSSSTTLVVVAIKTMINSTSTSTSNSNSNNNNNNNNNNNSNNNSSSNNNNNNQTVDVVPATCVATFTTTTTTLTRTNKDDMTVYTSKLPK
jgi:hypothetical protein